MDNIRYLPLALFSIYSTKLILLGSTLESSISLLVIGGLTAFYEYKSQDKKLRILQKEFKDLKEFQDIKAKEVDELRSHILGLKFANQLKPSNRA
jgi:hypothetical protein